MLQSLLYCCPKPPPAVINLLTEQQYISVPVTDWIPQCLQHALSWMSATCAALYGTLVDAWCNKPEAVSESKLAGWHATMMNLKAHVLDAQGSTEQVLLVALKVHDIVKLSLSTYQPCFLEMIESMHHEVWLQWSLGDNGEALQVAKEALRLARDNKLELTVDGLLWFLHTVALTTLSCQDYKRAGEAAWEGCNISTGQNLQKNQWELDIFI
jgi:magnesium-transporting ATPase (P-type)